MLAFLRAVSSYWVVVVAGLMMAFVLWQDLSGEGPFGFFLQSVFIIWLWGILWLVAEGAQLSFGGTQMKVARVFLVYCVAVTVFVNGIRPGLRIAFALCRPSLERLADESKSGRPFPKGQRVGPYIIHGCEPDALLITADSGAPRGFARTEGAYVDYSVRLSENWVLFEED